MLLLLLVGGGGGGLYEGEVLLLLLLLLVVVVVLTERRRMLLMSLLLLLLKVLVELPTARMIGCRRGAVLGRVRTDVVTYRSARALLTVVGGRQRMHLLFFLHAPIDIPS